MTEKVYNTAHIRALEQAAFAQGIAAWELMQRAGRATFDHISKQWPMSQSLCVVCGAGNNAGDGYIIAALAQAWGWRADVVALSVGEELPEPARIAYQAFKDTGGVIREWSTKLPDADVYVDALFGIGLSREVTGTYKKAIVALNALTKPVVAVDIPSGLNADTGCVMGVAVYADLTVTYIGLKQGLLTGQAADYVGHIVCNNLKLPAKIFKTVSTPAGHLLESHQLAPALPKRPRNAHKGMAGHTLIVGGAPSMAGAVRLAGEAALRTGSGLVTVATHPIHAMVLNSNRPEMMVAAVEYADHLLPLVERASVVAIGPGLARGTWSQEIWKCMQKAQLPLVVDADALNLLAQQSMRRSDWVLTPHPGEAGRLLGSSAQVVEQDRIAAIYAIRERYNGTIVLKGAGTLILGDEGLVFCTAGNPGMASGGMGDVLTGIIAALIAQRFSPEQAARIGVLAHAIAGDIAAQQGERGLLASDLIAQLRVVVNP